MDLNSDQPPIAPKREEQVSSPPPTPAEQTPESPTLAVETVRPASTKRKRSNKPKTYDEQLKADRKAVKTHVTRTIRATGKWGMMTPEDQRAFVRKEMEAKLTQREKGESNSARALFPDKYDAVKEFGNVWEHIERNQPVERIDNNDDDENLPSSSRIKSESAEDEVDKEGKERGAKRSRTDDTKQGEGGETESEPVDCKLFCSGLEIRLGKVGHSKVERRIGTKRSWAWINMKLVVWPPF